MGFRLTTMQVTGRDRAVIWRLLRVRPSDTTTDPVGGVSGSLRPDGAYLIVAMNDRGGHAEPDLLSALSEDAHLLVCQIHEGCMWSQIAGWCNGRQVWAVEYGREDGPRDLEVAGTPPPELMAIHEACETRQAAEPVGFLRVDRIFDIAPTLYAALTGYRYDRVDRTAVFEHLVPV